MAIVLSGSTGIDAGSLPVNNCGNTEVEGNLNLSGVGTRITGDFSNATASNRVMFQSNVTNGNTGVYAIPNTVSGAAAFRVTNSNDLVNTNSLEISASQGGTAIISNSFGTASPVPLAFIVSGSERIRIDTAGNVGIGTGSNINAKLDVQGSIRQYNPSTTANSVINHVNDSKNWYVGLRGDSSNAYSIADETRHRLLLDTTGNTLHLSPLGGLGYGTGAGGTVTQLTSKSTAVTLNKPSGRIFLNNAALAAGATVSFTLNNSVISGTDEIILSIGGDGSMGSYRLTSNFGTVGSTTIHITNTSAGSLSESIALKFEVIKGAIA